MKRLLLALALTACSSPSPCDTRHQMTCNYETKAGPILYIFPGNQTLGQDEAVTIELGIIAPDRTLRQVTVLCH